MMGVAGKEPDIGTTARTVAANVERLRRAHDLNYKQLSERLQDAAGWSINAVGIRRIESGERRVTPDDLVALALGLGVSPATLLMPVADKQSDQVSVTGVAVPIDAARVWEWLTAQKPLLEDGNDSWVEFVHTAWPGYRIRRIYEDAYRHAAEESHRTGIDLDALAAEFGIRAHGDD